MLEMHVIVNGDVQGVGFRATTKRIAQSLEITGFVRNLQDGAVEICAQGEKKALEALIEKLEAHFSSHFQVSYRDAQKVYTEFLIVH